MPHPAIIAIGTSVPGYKISQERYCSHFELHPGLTPKERLWFRKISRQSGIEYRHSVLKEFENGLHPDNAVFNFSPDHLTTSVSGRMDLYECHAADLCMQAVNECLARIPSLPVSEISHIITFSCTGMSAPGLDIQLAEKLGLSRSVERISINFMGCYAGVNALKLARHISRSQPGSVILLAGVELCTLHFRKGNTPDQMVANTLFGDGAAAAVVSSRSPEPEGRNTGLLMHSFYTEFEAAGKEDMVWKIGDYGFDLKLSAYVPQLIKENIRSLITKLLSRCGICREEIDHFAFHPGGRRILEACEEAMHLSKHQNEIPYSVLNDYGNMSSVTIFFVLKKYLDSLKKKNRGEKILACAFGPGITMESFIAEVA